MPTLCYFTVSLASGLALQALAQTVVGVGPVTIFSLADALVLNEANGLMGLGPDLSYSSTWTVERDARLGRPHLSFTLPQESPHALVTRLQRSPDGLAAVITLYLETGMELVLYHSEGVR